MLLNRLIVIPSFKVSHLQSWQSASAAQMSAQCPHTGHLTRSNSCLYKHYRYGKSRGTYFLYILTLSQAQVCTLSSHSSFNMPYFHSVQALHITRCRKSHVGAHGHVGTLCFTLTQGAKCEVRHHRITAKRKNETCKVHGTKCSKQKSMSPQIDAVWILKM